MSFLKLKEDSEEEKRDLEERLRNEEKEKVFQEKKMKIEVFSIYSLTTLNYLRSYSSLCKLYLLVFKKTERDE